MPADHGRGEVFNDFYADARIERFGEVGKSADPTAVTVSRAKPQGLTRAQLEAVLGADATKLPTAVGVPADDGSFVVVRINQLQPRDAAVIDDKRAAQQYTGAWARAEGQAYLAALKSQYKAVIKVAAPASAASAP